MGVWVQCNPFADSFPPLYYIHDPSPLHGSAPNWNIKSTQKHLGLCFTHFLGAPQFSQGDYNENCQKGKQKQ